MNPDFQRQQKLINLALAGCLLLAIIGVALAVFGYGKISNTMGNAFQLQINGHSVTADSLKVRPGSYKVEITSARYATVRETIHVGLFGTTELTRPTEERDADQLIRSVIAANGLYGPPTMGGVQWLENNTWLVGLVGPGSATPIALHYLDRQWQVGYFDISGYPRSKANLPTSVASVLERYENHAQ